MAENDRTSIVSRIRRMVVEVGGVSDAELLQRFVATRDEAAFELVLWRHAGLVFSVCRRVLHDEQEAEDALQATFLILVRQAGRIVKREGVASWLYKVAYRVAWTARDRRAKRIMREKCVEMAKPPNPADASENEELRQVLDQEIGRLPERFRTAVILCYLQGKSVDEAARRLGCPRGTVASRLARARERLRKRLGRRGFTPMAVLAALAPATSLPTPLSQIPTLTRTAMRCVGRGLPTDGSVSPHVLSLTQEVLRAMVLRKVQTGVLFIAFVVMLLAGGGVGLSLYARSGPEAEPPKVAESPAAARAVTDQPAKANKDAAPIVTVVHPVQRQVAPSEWYNGRLEAVRSLEVRPTVSGFVQKVCFKTGAEVKPGDVLFVLDSRTAQLALAKAEADLALAETKQKLSEAALKEQTKEYNSGVLSAVEMVKARDRAVTARAAVNAARIERDSAKLALAATTITAPISGRIGRPLVEAGALVFRGPDRATLLTTIMSYDPITVVFDMDTRSFLRYQRLLREHKVKGVGSRIAMRLPDEKTLTETGTLESFGDRVNSGYQTVAVRGQFANPGQLLLPGMFVQVRVTFGPRRQVMEVAADAIQHYGLQNHAYVLLAKPDNIVFLQRVTLGQMDDDRRIVEKGLTSQDRVIVSGLSKLHPGDHVHPREAAMPKHHS